MKCLHCGVEATLYVVGDRYCEPCKREMRAREPKQSASQPIWLRRLQAKDFTPPLGAA